MASFECKSGSIELCQCNSVVLAEYHQEYIHALYDECLCTSCLAILRHQYDMAAGKDDLASPMMR